MNGLIIAKDGFDITGDSDELYVDPSTFLHKVMINTSGVFSTNGTTWSSRGEYKFELDPGGGGTASYSVVIPIPDIDYMPQYRAYLDQSTGSKRVQIGSIIANFSNQGELNGFAQYRDNSIVLTVRFNSVGGALLPGEYGWFLQVYYERVGKK